MVSSYAAKNRIPAVSSMEIFLGSDKGGSIGFADTYTLFCFETALGTALIDGSEYPLCSNCAVLLTPLSFYRFNFECEPLGYVATFSLSDVLPIVSEHFNKLLLSNSDVPSPILLRGVSENLGKTLLRVLEYKNEARENELYLNMLFSEAILLTDGALITPSSDDLSSLSVRVFDYLSENFDAPFSLERLASRFFKSKYHLSRLFLSFTGLPPHKFVTMKRLAKAKILIDGGMPKQSAATAVGYSNYSVFYRAYQKQYGRE